MAKTYKLKDRIISIITAVVMVFTMLPQVPVTAFAEETDTTVCTHHIHSEECGYAAAVEEVPCVHTHDESCGYVAAVDEVLCECTDTDENGAVLHTENCGYTPAVEQVPCSHTHDENCGYAPAAAGTPCTWTAENCAECNPADDGEAEPAVECSCETYDETVHATNCPLYTPVETPQCFCTEKCTEPNLWCDICGFDVTACQGGADEGVPYADATITSVSITVDNVLYNEGNITITPATQSIVYTVTGTNFADLSDNNMLLYVDNCIIHLTNDMWHINTVENTATHDFIELFDNLAPCKNSEVMYSNDGGQTWIGTGIYLTYDDGIAEEDKAQITDVSVTVDGQTYTKGNITITPTSTVVFTLYGTKFENMSKDGLFSGNGKFYDPIANVFTVYTETNTAVWDCTNDTDVLKGCNGEEVQYSNDGGQTWIGTGIYLTYECPHETLNEDGICTLCYTQTYNLWVGGERFTSDKLTINDGNGGTATYDPDTKTLTLNNYTYNGEGYYDDTFYTGICYTYSDTLNLKLIGTNSVTVTRQGMIYKSYGIYSEGDIIVSGDGSLTANGGVARNYSYGVYTLGDITISDSASLTANGGGTQSYSYGVYASGGITISDSASLTSNGDEAGVNAGGIITVSGNGSLTANGYDNGVSAGEIIVNGGKVVAQGNSGAFQKTPNINNSFNAGVWYGESEAAAHKAGVKDTSDLESNYNKKYVMIADKMAKFVTHYGLWVGGVQFTSDKLTINDGNGGTATYNPDTKTLTLNNYTYKGEGYKWTVITSTYGAAIYSKDIDMLNLELIGTNSVTQQSTTDFDFSYGIYILGEIKVSGDGSLTATSGVAGSSYGVYVNGDIIVSESASLTANGGVTGSSSYGVNVNGDITVSDSASLTATGNEAGNSSYGVYVNGGITVSGDGSLTANGGTAQSYSYGVDANGNITVSENASLTAKGGGAQSYSYGMYVSYNITVSGNGSLTATSGVAQSYSYGMQVFGNIEVSGNTSLTAKGSAADSNSYGMQVFGNTEVSDYGKLETTGDEAGNSYGMQVFGNTEVAGNASLTAKGSAADSISYGMQVFNNIKVSDYGKLEATSDEAGNSYGVEAGDITVSGNGSLTAKGGAANSSYGSSYGVSARDITVSDSASLTAKGGVANSNDGESYGVSASDITVTGGTVEAQGEKGAFKNRAPSIDNTLVVFDEEGTVIEEPVWTGEGALTYAKIAEHKNKEYIVYTDKLHDVWCTDCGIYIEEEEHKNDSTGKCELCGYYDHEHTIKVEYADATYHSEHCTVEPCFVWDELLHDYSDGTCTECGAVKPTGIFIAGNLVAEGNYVDCEGNVSSTQPEGGYAHYKNGKLTLNDFKFHGSGYVEEDSMLAAVYIRQDVEIVLEGNNSIICTEGDVIKSVYGDITFSGTGSLELTTLGGSDGIDMVDCNIVINGGEITITSNDHGIELDAVATDKEEKVENSDADITINDGVLNITASDDGIDAEDTITINGGTVTIKAADIAIDSGEDIIVKGGKLDLTVGEYYSGMEASGTIDISGGYMEISSGNDGIDAKDTITINGGTVTIKAADIAIDSDKDIIVTGGKLDLTGGEYHSGMDAGASIDISGGYMEICAGKCGIEAGASIDISGGYIEINAQFYGIYSDYKMNITGGNMLIYGDTGAVMAKELTLSGKAEVVSPENAIVENECILDENRKLARNVEIISHRHDWEYTADGVTITLTCKNPDGDCYDTDGGRVILYSPEGSVYTGSPVVAGFVNNIKADNIEKPTLHYSPENKLTEGVPVDAGEYTVTMKLGGKEVSLKYTIDPEKVTYTAPAANELTYNGTQQRLVTAGTVENGIMYYSLDGENWHTDIPTAKDAGTYTIWYKIDANKNYEDVSEQSLKVTVETAEIKVTSATANDKTYDGTISAEVRLITIDGVVTDDNVYASATAQFEDANAGKGKAVKLTDIILTGDDAANYSLTATEIQTAADINPAPITVTPKAGQSKAYGTEDPVFEYEIKEGLYGTDKLTGALGRAEGDTVNEYDYTIGTLANPNYSITLDTTNKFAITRATPVVTAVSAEIAANETYAALVTITGTANAEGTFSLKETSATFAWGENTAEYVFTPADIINYTTATGTVTVTVTDTVAPTGIVTVEENEWSAFINDITFGLLFNKTVDVKVTADDKLSGIKSVEYIESGTALTQDAVKQLTGWTDMGTDYKVSVTAEDAKQFVYYIRITDKADNVTIISSDGMVFDLTPPEISGITDGATYYTTQKYTVTDKNEIKAEHYKPGGEGRNELVFKDGPLTGSLEGNVDITYTVEATDKVGNITKVTVKMKTIASISETIKDLTVENVTGDNADTIKAVEDALAAIDTTNATDAEKAEITVAQANIDSLQQAVKDTAAEVKALEDTLAGYNKDTVKSTDETAVDQLIADLTAKLKDANLSAQQKTALTEALADAQALAQQIDNDKAAFEDANNSVPAVDTDKVTADNAEDLAAAKDKLEDIVDNDNYTEEQQKAAQEQIDKIEELEKIIEETKAAVDDATAKPDYEDVTADTVTSEDKHAVEDNIAEIDQLLNNTNVSDSQKEELAAAKDAAQDLLEKIAEDKAAKDNAIGAQQAVTDKNVTADDTQKLKDTKAALEALKADDNYTEAEKAEIQEEIDRIKALEEVIEETKESVDKAVAEDGYAGKTEADITSAEKDKIEANVEAVEELLDTDNLTEEQRKDLEDTKAKAEELLKEIKENSEILDNVLKAEKDTTADNYQLSDKEDLKEAAKNLKAVTDESNKNYTAEEKQAVQDELDRINDIIKDIEGIEDTIEKAEDAADKQNNVEVVPNNKEAVEAAVEAKQAYDQLDERQKELLGQETAEQINNMYENAVAFEIIEGANGSWTKGGSKGLAFTANGDFYLFTSVKVDGVTIGTENYTAVAGSTVVTLNAEYLKSLKTGKHTLAVVYSVLGEEHTADCEFTVKAIPSPQETQKPQATPTPTDNVPKTGDTTNSAGWMAVMLSSMVALAVVIKKKKNMNTDNI